MLGKLRQVIRMKGISSVANDKFLGKQIGRFERPEDAFKEITTIQQLDGVVPLNQNELYSFVDNFTRLHLRYHDNKERERKLKADAFEEKVRNWLQAVGADYVPERMLQNHNRRRQQAGLPALPTPDFLLKVPIQVDNFLVHWVECKNYYGLSTTKAVDRLGFLRAGRKYYDRYGTGIVVFHYGFNKDLNVPAGVQFKSFQELKRANLKF